jgi:hypothetical protein
MEQTAIEWLEDNLISEPWVEEHFKHNSECWDKAKEMERQQIIDAYNTSFILRDKPYSTADKYYTETFKSE